MTSDGARILVVDDEQEVRRLLNIVLRAHGYHVQEVEDGQNAIIQTAIFHPDLLILDLGLPDMDGIDVIKRIREWSKVPILILSARGQEETKIAALDAGADDYITKPFGMGELLARIRVALRHAAKSDDDPVITVGDLVIDLSKHMVTLKGNELKLTPTEYEILKLLALHAGKVITHKQLLKAVWGPEYENETHYLRVYIGQLRRKIEDDPIQPKYIITEPGIGYRLMG
ncbi:two-component system KDP operon response regulator KdpE [Caldicoprobacter guelmensis]|uniref:response regulator n=1 Tax=Caldicoprobacter guelmensis TaxID=1170224 RepID=UPI001958713A|nr:response regulator [Caldicoprobacter guelmensis]MBM7583314.1 two-component system KDP operon response regulator KdpE [Caldicoprobacter guelmensis]